MKKLMGLVLAYLILIAAAFIFSRLSRQQAGAPE